MPSPNSQNDHSSHESHEPHESHESHEPPTTAASFDLNAARDALGGDEELLAIVVNAFLEESPKLLDDIRKAVQAQDHEGLRIAAHALKGSVRYYGETATYSLAYQLETAAAAGSCDGAAATLSRLETEVAGLCDALTPLA